MTREEIIEKFQCPGCVGCDFGITDQIEKDTWIKGSEMFACKNHCPGTRMSGVGQIYLGLPRGFNKVGAIHTEASSLDMCTSNIQFFLEKPTYDHLNIPVWGMCEDGFLFIRVYSPRVNRSYIHVVQLEDGDLELPEGIVFIVSDFIDEID